MSTIVSVRECIDIERQAGSSEIELCRLLNASSITPPTGFTSWTPDALVEVAGMRPHGLTRHGRRTR